MTAPTSVPVSVVMPAYNEADGIRVAVAAAQQHVLDKLPGAELVVVNDGSRDNTGSILDEIAAADPRVRVLHTPNGGHGTALMRGLAYAQGDYVFLVDSDDQIPLDAFWGLWTRAHESNGAPLDGVFGIRRVRHDAQFRKVLTRFIGFCLMLLFGTSIRDANVPFKLVRRQVWLEAQPYIPDGTLAPSLFLAVYMKRTKRSLAFVDVAHRDRLTGTVSIRRWKLIKFCAKGFQQLLDFRRALPSR